MMKGERQRILVVEDSATQAQMLKVMLEEINMEIEFAETLGAAFDLLKVKTYDAILLDLVLPDSSGMDTLMAMSAIQPWTPILVLTSLEEESLGYAALKAGAEDYLVKGEVSQFDLARALRYGIERKRQSAKLHESEQRLRTTLNNTYDAFIAVDENLKIVEWNIKAEELFGYSLREARGQDLVKMCFPNRDSIAMITSLKRYLASKEIDVLNTRRELTGRHRGGREFPAEVAFFPVQQNDSVTLCTFVSDITDRKQFERHANDFYSTVAHELRAPLTSIRGSLGILEAGFVGPITEEARQMVSIGATSCERLIRLITDLLDLSKVEAGKMPLNIEETRADELLKRAVSECSGTAASRAQNLVTQVEPNLAVAADSDRIVQVLINLMSNALKNTPTGGTVTASARITDNDKIRFTVADEGPGISPASAELLFQKFQQLDDGQEKSGSGLGLAISKAIVALHKGDIGVTSQPGKGASFWIDLPLQSVMPVTLDLKSKLVCAANPKREEFIDATP